MIDFRYHVVSLVSVFLALAVGIVLGEGPLKGTIGSTLNGQVDSLRKDRDALRIDLGTAEAGVQHRDDYITAITPNLVSEQLGGRSVVLVTLPGIDTGTIKPLTQGLQTAGAKVTGRVDVASLWMDPAKSAFRDELVTQLRSSVPAGTPSAKDTDGELSVLLARAIVTAELAESQRSDSTATTLLSALESAGLVNVDGDLGGRATEAVLVTPGVQQATSGSSPTSSPKIQSTGPWVTLAKALDTGSDGAVAVGPPSSATAGGVVAAVRVTPALGKNVSTVDTGGTPMGVVTTVFALREQLYGAAGNYGFGDGATTPMPVVTAVAKP